MKRTMLKSKIHRCYCTEADLDYEGSITIDPDLMDAARLLPYERVDVLDITNGARLQTYVIEGPRGKGEICINGAAAHLIHPKDLLIICSFVTVDEVECAGWEGIRVHVDRSNRAVEIEGPSPVKLEPALVG